MVSRLAYRDAWNWNGIYNYSSVGNNCSWSATLPHNEFHPAIFDEQRGELSWGACGCRHGMCLKAWRMSDHVNVCQNDTGGVSSGFGSVEYWHGSGGAMTHGCIKVDDDNVQVRMLGHVSSMGRWQTQEEGCRDTGMHGDGGIQMCLVQGVITSILISIWRNELYATPFFLDRWQLSTCSIWQIQSSFSPTQFPLIGWNTPDWDYCAQGDKNWRGRKWWWNCTIHCHL